MRSRLTLLGSVEAPSSFNGSLNLRFSSWGIKILMCTGDSALDVAMVDAMLILKELRQPCDDDGLTLGKRRWTCVCRLSFAGGLEVNGDVDEAGDRMIRPADGSEDGG